MAKKEEFRKLKKEAINAVAKEVPRAITLFFVLIISITLYFIYKWKILLVPIAVCITYYLVGFGLILVLKWTMKKTQEKIDNNSDLDF